MAVYKCIDHASTGQSPANILFNQKMREKPFAKVFYFFLLMECDFGKEVVLMGDLLIIYVL